MMPTAVASAAGALGKSLVAEPFRVPLEVPGRDERLLLRRAIYMAFTGNDVLDYIGKVDRMNSTAYERLREHIRSSRRKRYAWRWLWVIPVSDTFEDILGFERALITLHRPPGNVQHAIAA